MTGTWSRRPRLDRHPIAWRSRWALLVAAWFLAVDAYMLVATIQQPARFGVDARIYTEAAATWLAGGNPWSVSDTGFMFAAPPPTLLFALPFVPLGSLAAPVIAGLTVVAAIVTAHRLGLPAWAIAFPPFVEAAIVGNPDAVVVALLLVGAGPLAVLAKIYAIVPPVILGAWRQVALALIALLVTAPLLPWGLYLSSFSEVSATLAEQTGNYSAWGSVFVLVAIAALVLVPRTRAAWLAVPAVWPSTQFHYGSLGLPGASPLAAAALAIPAPIGGPLIAVLITVVETRFMRAPLETGPSGGLGLGSAASAEPGDDRDQQERHAPE